MDKQPLKITKGEMFEKIHNTKGGICVIFGAGASYGYTDRTNEYYQPPVVAEIFDDNNRTVNEVIHREEHAYILRQREFFLETLENYENDLEAYLSFLYNNNSDDDTFPLMLSYLHDVFSLSSIKIDQEHNNYLKLLYQLSTLLGKSSWSCISFNYDTILEQSYIATGRNRIRDFGTYSNYIDENPKIIKIHGSVNFSYQLEEPSSKNKLRNDKDIFNLMMSNGSKDKSTHVFFQPKVSSKPFYVENRRWVDGSYQTFNEYNFPLMMIPIHGTKKTENVFFQEMIEIAKEQINSSTLVVSIGYNFGDDLFINEIKQLKLDNKELILVGTENLVLDPVNNLGYKNATLFWPSDKIKIFEGNGFGEFVKSIIKKNN